MKTLFFSQNIWDSGGEWFARTNKCKNIQCLASNIKGAMEEQLEEGWKTLPRHGTCEDNKTKNAKERL